ncbi:MULTISPECIES: hypothetical protein [Psychrobacter]|uniref:Uncharacterized protein n=1 Tax=Psychrobacter communis TaxID=2762238 RepID=A0ABR8RLB5_9GAMM|nr:MULTISPECIES: hypothetical protein [Psychrobacter]MBD7948579.1 hypothetical protein [Psychrobacter communis]MBO6199840.1 hypothetical protein [Psychrobacter sp.]MDN5693438.1 hypothetical protein [Psychrobacter sp.]
MQIKHLIIFALAGIVILAGFNMISGSQREKNREALAASSETENTDIVITDSKTSDIVSQPLGQQPKAILDKASTQIEQAEQVSQQRSEQIANTQ